MTERTVKRVVLGSALASVSLLTALAVAGLVVITRGPQAESLPLVRTQIAAVDGATSDAGEASGVASSPYSVADHSTIALWPPLASVPTTAETLDTLGSPEDFATTPGGTARGTGLSPTSRSPAPTDDQAPTRPPTKTTTTGIAPPDSSRASGSPSTTSKAQSTPGGAATTTDSDDDHPDDDHPDADDVEDREVVSPHPKVRHDDD